MRTRHQAFMQEVDAKVARQVREEWSALRAGDRVVVMLDGRRQAVTVVALEQPDLRVRTDDGREVVTNRYQYIGLRPKGDAA